MFSALFFASREPYARARGSDRRSFRPASYAAPCSCRSLDHGTLTHFDELPHILPHSTHALTIVDQDSVERAHRRARR